MGSNPFRAAIEASVGEKVLDTPFGEFKLSGEGISLEERFRLMFPDPALLAQDSDHCAGHLKIEGGLNDHVVSGARTIIAAYKGEKPDITEVVQMAITQPGLFIMLEGAASEVLGLTPPSTPKSGPVQWGAVYQLARKAWRSEDEEARTELIREIGLLAKNALRDFGQNVADVDAVDTDPAMESLRGNSDAADSGGQ